LVADRQRDRRRGTQTDECDLYMGLCVFASERTPKKKSTKYAIQPADLLSVGTKTLCRWRRLTVHVSRQLGHVPFFRASLVSRSCIKKQASDTLFFETFGGFDVTLLTN